MDATKENAPPGTAAESETGDSVQHCGTERGGALPVLDASTTDPKRQVGAQQQDPGREGAVNRSPPTGALPGTQRFKGGCTSTRLVRFVLTGELEKAAVAREVLEPRAAPSLSLCHQTTCAAAGQENRPAAMGCAKCDMSGLGFPRPS